MSVYSTGAEAYRDTTKWLITLVPLASLVAAAAVVGPRLVTGRTAAGSWSAWITTYWAALLGCILVLAGIWLTVTRGTRVLSTAPKEIPDLIDNQGRFGAAFSAGAVFPYFLNSQEYKGAVLLLNAAPPGDPDIPTERVTAASTQLLEWALFDALRAEFGPFKRWFLWGIALIAAGLVLAVVGVYLAPAPIAQPAAAVVRLSSTGTTALIRSTGCRAPSTTQFVAVSGTWSSPVLETEGPGCRINAKWRPSLSQAQVLPASASNANPSQGPPGPQGPAGPAGPPGPQGAPGTPTAIPGRG